MKKRWSRKWLIYPFLALCICGISGIGTASAYLSDTKVLDNKAVVGELSSITEEEFSPPASASPGQIITKKPYVTNNGTIDCYVRMMAAVSDAKLDAVFIGLNTTDWISKSDGEGNNWYYYKHILKPGQSTVPLFTGVKMPSNNDIFDVFIYSESTTTRNADGTLFNDQTVAWEASAND